MLVTELFAHLDRTLGEQVNLLGKLVEIDSGTDQKAGVDQVGRLLAPELQALGLQVERCSQREPGGALIGRKPGRGGPEFLLVGHMDTVCPRPAAGGHTWRVGGNRFYGPGACDMKGGLVTLLYALKGLKLHAPAAWERAGLRVVLISDQESGMAASRALLAEHAAVASCACIVEAARPGGEYVRARHGIGRFRLRVKGRPAHPAMADFEGANAIAELAVKVVALQGMNNPRTGLSVNVGLIRGGERVNVVPAMAECEIDLRASSAGVMEEAQMRLERIAASSALPGTEATLSGEFLHPPVEYAPAAEPFWRLLERAGADAGFPVRLTVAPEGSAGAITSRYTPTLDGMGPRGGGAHGGEEWVEINSLPERAKALARFLELCTLGCGPTAKKAE